MLTETSSPTGMFIFFCLLDLPQLIYSTSFYSQFVIVILQASVTRRPLYCFHITEITPLPVVNCLKIIVNCLLLIYVHRYDVKRCSCKPRFSFNFDLYASYVRDVTWLTAGERVLNRRFLLTHLMSIG